MADTVLGIEQIRIDGRARDKAAAIAEAAQILEESGAVTADYLPAMLEREKVVSTYMGNYLAIPHGTNEAKDAILRSSLSLVRYDEPIDWDGNEVRFVIGIAGRENEHLSILSKIAIIFSEDDEVERLLAAGSRRELLDLLGDVNSE